MSSYLAQANRRKCNPMEYRRTTNVNTRNSAHAQTQQHFFVHQTNASLPFFWQVNVATGRWWRWWWWPKVVKLYVLPAAEEMYEHFIEKFAWEAVKLDGKIRGYEILVTCGRLWWMVWKLLENYRVEFWKEQNSYFLWRNQSQHN